MSDAPLIHYGLAALPILVVSGLMVLLGWNGQRAAPAGWLVGLVVAALVFGLTPEVLWVSQVKGLLLSLFVLAVLWPALLLYNIVAQAKGIHAIARGLEQIIVDRGLRLVVVAWAFSGMLEGLAGFGLPIAIVAPMLVKLGVGPVTAVAAVAVGHAWSVTFGDMGVIFQTLVAITQIDGTQLAPTAALMLGAACLGCGLATAYILGQGKRWPSVIGLALLMSGTQYALAVLGLTSLAAFGAGLAGILGGMILSRWHQLTPALPADPPAWTANPHMLALARTTTGRACPPSRPLIAALASYGSLAVLMAAIALIQPLYDVLHSVAWQITFPAVATRTGFVTAAGMGQMIRPFVHPGTSILLVACLSYALYRLGGLSTRGSWRQVAAATWRSAAPASAGIIAMVGLSTIMEHCGMTLLLAQGSSSALGQAFPLVSPLVGVLGAFATGSNNNSNVLLAPLQQNAALLLAIAPPILLAAQTAGGALGSMLAPAKIIVGCSTVGLKGREGEILRVTLPYGLLIGLGLGFLAMLLSR